MKREQVTKFDLEAAFKALDEIEIPKVSGLKPNRINISESTKKVDKTSLLLEDYYDLRNNEDVEAATEEREAEIAKAKLARIEKIVDIDAETEEDILPSYVGKTIVQCPQCMTLYYRKPEDLVKSEEDEDVVNVGEQCPNCGHVDGYTVIGKVAAEEPEEIPTEEIPEEVPVEEPVEEEPVESEEELPAAEEIPEEEPAELERAEVPEEENEEETNEEEEEPEEANESLKVCEKCGKNPCECVEKENKEVLTEDTDLNKALNDHNEYINYLQKQIEEEEKELASIKNEEVKSAIQRKIDNLKSDLDAALPEAVKSKITTEKLPAADEIPEEAIEGEEEEPKIKNEAWESFKRTHMPNYDKTSKKIIKEEKCEGRDCVDEKVCKVNKGINHTEEEDIKILNEDNDDEIVTASGEKLVFSDAAIDELFNSEEFNTPISEEEVEAYLDESKKSKKETKNSISSREILKNLKESTSKKKIVGAREFLKANMGDLKEGVSDKKSVSSREILKNLKESADYHQDSISARDELRKLIHSNNESIDFKDAEELDEESCNAKFSKYFKEVYDNVDDFKVTECETTPDTLIVEGIIKFKSGKQKTTRFTFNKVSNNLFEGFNKDITNKKAFRVVCKVNKNKSIITEGLSYRYTINKTLVKGKIK